jgi:hypothetical protein
MNAYRDDLNALYAATPAYNSMPAVLLRTSPPPRTNTPVNPTLESMAEFNAQQIGGVSYEFEYRLRHAKRYLHFRGAGKIADPAGIEPDVTLSPGSDQWGVVDLDGVSWLLYGQWYKVQRVEGCMELDDA